MIVGAGLSGLIASAAFPLMRVWEKGPEPSANHGALLRFRSRAVAELTGIEFREVTVRKGIWWEGAWHSPNIRAANSYSRKVLGGPIMSRSIWDTSAVTRYVAPEDFYEQLLGATRGRIDWGAEVDFRLQGHEREPMISTAPLGVVMEQLDLEAAGKFLRSPIWVERFRIADADVHQTIYYPTADHSLYRASITGDLMICEFTEKPEGDWTWDLMKSFGLGVQRAELEPLGSVEQKYGKIAPIPEQPRRAAVARLSTEHNIYSLGRFATWRNILLDDVVHDAAVIKRLLTASAYDRRMTYARP